MNLETLHKYKEDGLLRCQTHPTLPLTIWNYTEKVQYERLWDDVTLACRGLVTDDLGNVVARPFKKFFNIEEGKHLTGTGEFEVYEKMDGSLGILFNYKGDWLFATRGSFTSEQSIKFKEIFESKYKYSGLNIEFTYMFEIIYPENRIVVDYGEVVDCVLLGKIKTGCGSEWSIDHYAERGFNCVKKYDGIKDWRVLKETIKNNQEGFIIHFNSTGSKCKIKGEEYLRLHKIMTEVSTTGIWESLKNGDDIADLLKDVPDEFYDKINEYVDGLVAEYDEIESTYTQIFNELKNIKDRARFAELAKKLKYPQLLFKMLDDSDYSEAIWRIIKPEWRKL